MARVGACPCERERGSNELRYACWQHASVDSSSPTPALAPKAGLLAAPKPPPGLPVPKPNPPVAGAAAAAVLPLHPARGTGWMARNACEAGSMARSSQSPVQPRSSYVGMQQGQPTTEPSPPPLNELASPETLTVSIVLCSQLLHALGRVLGHARNAVEQHHCSSGGAGRERERGVQWARRPWMAAEGGRCRRQGCDEGRRLLSGRRAAAASTHARLSSTVCRLPGGARRLHPPT